MRAYNDSERLIDAVQVAKARGEGIRVEGHGSKNFLSTPNLSRIEGNLLSTLDHTGVINYSPDELVMTVRAGTTLSEIEDLLIEEGQIFPSDPPCYGGQGTIGGAIATGISGPGRPWLGAVRDAILGIEIVNGLGERLNFGGQVMKNVAGYDISRLMVGSYGTMGIILSVSLKVLPRPQCVRTLQKEVPVEKLQKFMTRFFREPVPLTATYYEPDRLWIRLSGSEESVGDAVSRLDMDEDVDSAFWHRVRDQERAFFLTEKPLWKVSLPRGFDPKEIPEGWDYVSEWGGAQVWCRNNEVQGLSETATVNSFRNIENERQKQSVYSERLKKAFDPDAILNPGVLV